MGVEAKMMALSAAADYLGPGAVEIPIFQTEIVDIVRRSSMALRRFGQKPATGHPHRYFEQTAIATAGAVDPRNLSSTATGPTRVERYAGIKAVTGQTNISMFDKEVTEQQGQFAAVVAGDIEDIVSGIEVKRAGMLWAGSDTSLIAPTTLEWVGGLTQITQQATIASGASIIDGLKAQIAAMVANQNYDIRITAIYLNPVLANYIDVEAKASKIELKEAIVAGVTVTAIATQAGIIPLITDPYMPTDSAAKYGFSAPGSGLKNYYAAIITEHMVEIPVISGKEFDPNPRLFQLGLTGNLAGQYVGVKFDSIVFKGATYAHAVVAVVLP